jgi:hypothetical protein
VLGLAAVLLRVDERAVRGTLRRAERLYRRQPVRLRLDGQHYGIKLGDPQFRAGDRLHRNIVRDGSVCLWSGGGSGSCETACPANATELCTVTGEPAPKMIDAGGGPPPADARGEELKSKARDRGVSRYADAGTWRKAVRATDLHRILSAVDKTAPFVRVAAPGRRYSGGPSGVRANRSRPAGIHHVIRMKHGRLDRVDERGGDLDKWRESARNRTAR